MTIRAIIFDMGNTLLRYDPPDLRWRACEEPGIDSLYWELIGLGYCQKLSRDAFVDRLFNKLQQGWQAAVAGQANLRAADWIAGCLKELRVPPDVVPIDELVALYIAPRRKTLHANPGAAETLAQLREQGYRLGLISNTVWPGRFHSADLASLELLPFLEHLTFSGDAGLWKPFPAIFQTTAEALGANPAETVFVGDSPQEDILGAQAAGMRAIWMHTTEFPLGTVQPDGQITRLSELPPLLEGWR
jgi:HAD superfamily hydrolase (TIGR01509 family)